METRRIVLHPQTRAKLQRLARRCKNAISRNRYRIVLLTATSWSGKRIAQALGWAAGEVLNCL